MSQNQLEANKALVRKFFQTLFNDHKVDEGMELIHEDYIQHNQMVPPGKEPMRGLFSKGIDGVSSDVKQVLAEGDRVAIFHHLKKDPSSLGMAVIDIFRIQDGKLAEHWDVMAPILESPPFPKPLF